MVEREPYTGTTCKLVLAVDVIGAVHLRNYSFPAMARVSPNAKKATIIYYDKEGLPRAFGMKAL